MVFVPSARKTKLDDDEQASEPDAMAICAVVGKTESPPNRVSRLPQEPAEVQVRLDKAVLLGLSYGPGT